MRCRSGERHAQQIGDTSRVALPISDDGLGSTSHAGTGSDGSPAGLERPLAAAAALSAITTVIAFSHRKVTL